VPVSNEEQEFVSYVVDMMQTIGPVYSKRMFGGYGIFLEGLMFALIADSVLYLKADKESESDFNARGLGPFTYYKKGKPVELSYYQAPEETLEDVEVMNQWGNKGYSAALRAASKR
jgi:DNA transformation protein